MQDWLINLATDHSYLIYIIILSIAFIEGPIIALLSGFLVYMGYINPWLTVVILILGNVIPDMILYYIGRFSHGKEYIKKHFLSIKFIKHNVDFLDKMWEHHPWKTIFLLKVAYGNPPFLMSLGLIKISVKDFFYKSTVVSIILVLLVFYLGYNLSYSYEIAAKYIKYAGLFFAAIIVLFIFGYFFMTKYFMKKFVEEEKKEELF